MPLATKRTHVDPKKLMSDAKYRIDLGLAFDGSLKDLDQAQDKPGLLEAMELWLGSPSLRCGLDEEDLLVLALAQDLPYAFQVWKDMGQPINADTLLALTMCDPESFALKSWDALLPFVADELKPWHGAIFAHFLCLGNATQDLAIHMLGTGVISVDTPIPVSSEDARGWLWWLNPEEKCSEDSTLPLHAALKNKRWEVASSLANAGVDLTGFDALGHRPIDYLRVVMGFEREVAGKVGVASNANSQIWLDRLESFEQAQLLDTRTQEVNQAPPPRRL